MKDHRYGARMPHHDLLDLSHDLGVPLAMDVHQGMRAEMSRLGVVYPQDTVGYA